MVCTNSLMNKYQYKIVKEKPFSNFFFHLRHLTKTHFSIIFPEILNGPILKSRVLTLSHVTKSFFFSKILTSHFLQLMTIEMTYIYDDDVNSRICIVYEYIA